MELRNTWVQIVHFILRQFLNAEKEVFFLIRYCSEAAAIDTEHFRILFRGQVYNITFIDNVKYQNKTIKLRAALEKRGG